MLGWFKKWGLKLAFNAKVRRKLWKKMALQLDHGLSFYRSLEILDQLARSKGQWISAVYEDLLANNAKGGSLAQGLAPWVSAPEIMVISAGERENLAQGLRLAHNLLEQQGIIQRQVLQSTIYPLFLLVLVVALLVIIAKILIPQFLNILPETAFTGAAYALLVVSNLVASPLGLALGLGFLLLQAITFVSLPRWSGGLRKWADRFMPWSIYRQVVGASFLYTLAVLMRLGIKPRQIFAWSLANASQSPYLQERIRALDSEMALGKNLGQALEDCGYNFPSKEVIEDLIIYAELPNLEQQIEEIAREELETCGFEVKAKLKVLQISLLMLIVGLILFVLAAMASLQSALGFLSI